MQEILSAANRSNVTIHTLDPRGLRSQAPSDVLWRLSGETGGRAIVNTNSFDRGLDHVVDDASAYYLLAYAPTRGAADGKFHELQVRVRRKGLRVLARKGYWAPSQAELATATVPEAPAEVTSALRSLAEVGARRLVTTWTGVEGDGAGRTTVSFAWMPSAGRAAATPAVTTLRLVARGSDDRVLADERLASDRHPGTGGEAVGAASFVAPAGAVTLALTVEDGEGAVLDRWTERLTVPIPEPATVRLGTPRLFLARSVVEWRSLRASLAAATPTPRREFRRTDRVLVSVSAQGPEAGSRGPATASLLNRAGNTLASLAFSEDQGPTLQLELPLANLAAGDYLLRIVVEAGERAAQEHVAFRLVP